MKTLRFFLILFFLSCLIVAGAQASSKLDSLIANEPLSNDTLHYEYLISIADEVNKSNRAEALPFYHKARKIAEHINDYPRMGNINKFIGVNHLYLANNDSSKYYLQESSSYFRATGDSLRIIANNTNIALIYQRQNKIEEAVALYHKVIFDSENIEEWIEVIFAKINLASLLINQKSFDQALNYLNSIDADYDKFTAHLREKIIASSSNNMSKAEIDEQVQNDSDFQFIKSNYPSIYINQGICLKELGDRNLPSKDSLLTVAKSYLKKAIDTSGDNPYVNAYAYNNLGAIYKREKRWKDALVSFEKGLTEFKSINNTRGKILSLNNIGVLQGILNNHSKAGANLREALLLAEEIGFTQEIKDIHRALANNHEAQFAYDSAYHHFKLYAQVKDSINNVARVNAIQDLEIKYETDKEREEVARLSLENEIKTKAQQTQLILFLLGLVGLAGLGLFFYTRYKLSKQREIAEYQLKTNRAMAKFVPTEFVKSLGKESVTEVALGDEVEKEVTVLFSDIRSFSSISELMTPIENFRFVKKYVERMSPIVHRNGGFINQYLGDGIMAIFQNDPDDALLACIQMQAATESFNEELKSNNQDPIRVGMGIHTGSLVMGIIGDDTRQDAAIISDTVNSAARMESLTKAYGNKIVLSKSSLNKLVAQDKFQIRALGQATVKGKKQPLDIYECYDADSRDLQYQKSTHAAVFTDAVQAYYERDFNKSLNLFNKIYEVCPNDLVAYSFIKRINNMTTNQSGKIIPDVKSN